MANFPIQYSEAKPPATGPNVRWNLMPDTDGAIPKNIGEGLWEWGRHIQKTNDAIQHANDTMELSTLQRKEQEFANARDQQLTQTQDEQQRSKINDQYMIQVGKLISKRDTVNNAFQIHMNQVMPQRDVDYQRIDRTMKVNQAKDQFTFNRQAFLESGDLESYHKLLNNAQAIGIIGDAEKTTLASTAQSDSDLLRSERALLSGNVLGAATSLDQMNTATMTVDQLEKRNQLLNVAQRQLKQNSDAAAVSAIFDMAKNKDKSPTEKMQLGQQYLDGLKNSGISPERAGVMVDRIEKWSKDTPVKTDRFFKASVRTDILKAISKGDSTDPIKNKIIENSSKLDDTDFDELMKLADDPIKEKSISPGTGRTLLLLEDAYKSQIEFIGREETLPEYQMAMLNWATLPDNKNRTPAEVWRYGKELMATWKNKDTSDIQKEVLRQDVPTVTSDEQYNNLPAGTYFRDPKGTLRKKP